jgi:hypothetical protein
MKNGECTMACFRDIMPVNFIAPDLNNIIRIGLKFTI